jgi:hypothetical protein
MAAALDLSALNGAELQEEAVSWSARTLQVSTAQGVCIHHHPALPVGEATELPDGQLIAASGQRLDLEFAVWALRQQAA